jgi:hypothetical protein
MARGLTEFTVQQAVNFDSYSDWNYEELDMDGTPASSDASYITSINPAKKVVIYTSPIAGDAVDAGDTFTLTINGETATNKKIIVALEDLPFTLTGLAITSLNIEPNNEDASEEIAVLSFH